MSSSVRIRSREDEHFDLLVVWDLFLQYRYVISSIVLGTALLAAIVAWTITPTYRAEVVVSEVRTESLDAGGLAGQLRGLANLAGVSLGSSSGHSVERLAVLRSRNLVEEFIRQNELLPVLLPEGNKRRTMWFAVRKVRDKVLTIKEDTRSGLITVAMEWTEPATAARWANEFVALANEIIRQRDSQTAERNLAFLNQQIDKTTVVDLRRVLYGLIEMETKTLMLASSRDDYAFSVIDPAVPPEMKARPARILIVLLGAFLGLALGALFVAFRRMASRRVSHSEPRG